MNAEHPIRVPSHVPCVAEVLIQGRAEGPRLGLVTAFRAGRSGRRRRWGGDGEGEGSRAAVHGPDARPKFGNLDFP